jgi:hypothetical protein
MALNSRHVGCGLSFRMHTSNTCIALGIIPSGVQKEGKRGLELKNGPASPKRDMNELIVDMTGKNG